MNEQINSLIRSFLKIGGTYFVTRGLVDESTAQVIIAGLAAFIGLFWSHLAHSDSGSKPPGIAGPGLMALLFAGLALSGCTTVMNGPKAVVITSKGFGLHLQTSSTSANATPEVLLGFYSTRVMFMPTSTNGPINVPRYMDTFKSHTGWSLGEDLGDDVGFGEVLIGATTNDTSRAIWNTNTAKASP